MQQNPLLDSEWQPREASVGRLSPVSAAVIELDLLMMNLIHNFGSMPLPGPVSSKGFDAAPGSSAADVEQPSADASSKRKDGCAALQAVMQDGEQLRALTQHLCTALPQLAAALSQPALSEEPTRLAPAAAAATAVTTNGKTPSAHAHEASSAAQPHAHQPHESHSDAAPNPPAETQTLLSAHGSVPAQTAVGSERFPAAASGPHIVPSNVLRTAAGQPEDAFSELQTKSMWNGPDERQVGMFAARCGSPKHLHRRSAFETAFAEAASADSLAKQAARASAGTRQPVAAGNAVDQASASEEREASLQCDGDAALPGSKGVHATGTSSMGICTFRCMCATSIMQCCYGQKKFQIFFTSRLTGCQVDAICCTCGRPLR